MTTVDNGQSFRATLDPDGQGGHWLKVDRKLRDALEADRERLRYARQGEAAALLFRSVGDVFEESELPGG
jgi:hypothetical protein